MLALLTSNWPLVVLAAFVLAVLIPLLLAAHLRMREMEESAAAIGEDRAFLKTKTHDLYKQLAGAKNEARDAHRRNEVLMREIRNETSKRAALETLIRTMNLEIDRLTATIHERNARISAAREALKSEEHRAKCEKDPRSPNKVVSSWAVSTGNTAMWPDHLAVEKKVEATCSS